VNAAPRAGEGPPADAAERLARFEASLDPARPAAEPGVEVLGYGEVSAVLGVPSLPGWVCKRMAGFRDLAGAERYRALVGDYVEGLEAAGVAVVATDTVTVSRRRAPPVVYVLQPRLDPRGLGHRLLREADDARLAAALDPVLGAVGRVLEANRRRSDGRAFALDAQLSNWHFEGAAPPRLVDVGTPFLRRAGRDEIDVELFLAAVPPVARAWYRRQRAVERYLDDYFDARRTFVDLLGNFRKEGRGDRLPLGLARVNAWLAAHPGHGAAVTEAEVERYYRDDAAQLELFLRARRLDRWVRTRLLRGRYDFVLPGPIRR
jgi:hypothetical protein